MVKKMTYMGLGVLLGIVFAFFSAEVMAQYESAFGGKGFRERAMAPGVPADYGNLVAVMGTEYYFQSSNGNIYVLKERRTGEWETDVRVIART